MLPKNITLKMVYKKNYNMIADEGKYKKFKPELLSNYKINQIK